MPKVARMVVSGSRPSSGRRVLICSAAPKTAMTTAATRRASQKLPVRAMVVAPVKPPSMTRSPWAKLTTSMMPKIRVSPEATRARIMPFTMPLTVWMTNGVHGLDPQVLVDDGLVGTQRGGWSVVADHALLHDVHAAQQPPG